MHRCFVPSSFIDSWLKEHKTSLPTDVIHRLVDIVRISSKEQIAVFDGQGRQISGYLGRESGNNYISQGVFFQAPAPSPRIILAQAALEESKMLETLKRGCEFGVDSFAIFAAHRSAPYCFAKLKKRSDRLSKVLIDAARQSERLFVPELIFAEGLASIMGPAGVFGDLEASDKLSETLHKNFNPKADFLIVIGPEGGLTPSEIAFLQEFNLRGVRFGPYTQRAELAGLSAVAIFNAFCGRA